MAAAAFADQAETDAAYLIRAPAGSDGLARAAFVVTGAARHLVPGRAVPQGLAMRLRARAATRKEEGRNGA
jgi:hypothetical protein